MNSAYQTAWSGRAGNRSFCAALVLAVGVHALLATVLHHYLAGRPPWMPATELGKTTLSLRLLRQVLPPPEPVADPPPVAPPVPTEPMHPPEPAVIDPVEPPPAVMPDPADNARPPPAPLPEPEPLELVTPDPAPAALTQLPPPTPMPPLAGGSAQIRPHYPFVARLRGEEGTATVRASITRDGRVADASIIISSQSTHLDEAAVKAVRSARFVMPEGAPERTDITIPIEFQLTD